MTFHLGDRHIFMWQSSEILNIFNALTLKQVFEKQKFTNTESVLRAKLPC